MPCIHCLVRRSVSYSEYLSVRSHPSKLSPFISPLIQSLASAEVGNRDFTRKIDHVAKAENWFPLDDANEILGSSSLGDLFGLGLKLPSVTLAALSGSLGLLCWGLLVPGACAVALVSRSWGLGGGGGVYGLLVQFTQVVILLLAAFAEAAGVVGAVLVGAHCGLGRVATLHVAEVAHKFSAVSLLIVRAHTHRIERILNSLVMLQNIWYVAAS